jgi:hypothetical protein
LGKKPDGTVDAESNWWKTHTKVEFYQLSLLSSFFEPIGIAVLLYLRMILITLPFISLLQKELYLKKLQYGPPANLDLLEELFSDVVVDGSSSFVPGDDFGEEEDGDEGEEAQEQEPICDNPTRDNSVLSPKPLHLVIKR